MDDKIKDLFNSLSLATDKRFIDWKDGTEEREYYATILEKIVLFIKDYSTDEYQLTITNEIGATLFRIEVKKTSTLYEQAKSLYDKILSQSQAGTESIDSILEVLNRK